MKNHKKVFIIASALVIFLIVLAVGCFWYYVQGVRVNGEVVAFQDAEQLKIKLAETNPTTVVFRNIKMDVSDCIDTKVPDFDIKFGNQTVYKETSVNHDKLKEKVLNNQEFKNKLIEFELIDYDLVMEHVTPEQENDISVCTKMQYSQDFIDKYHACQKWNVEYENGLTTKDMSKYVSIKDNELVFDDSYLDEFIHKVEKKYDTQGRTMKVALYSDYKKTHKIKGGSTTWGTLINSAEELEALKEAFHSGKSLKKRYPIMKSDYGGEIGKTRIEVSIAKQTLWYYKKGKLVKKTSVVTGKSGHDTPKGVYYISERVPGKYLVGDGYKTWVNRWMRLTNMGVGLHDANWRSSFGGSIYHYSGSHGCVNLPPSFAYWLYPKTYVGMPVIVY